MIRAIVFDCFGVLTEDGWLAFLNAFVKEEDLQEARDLNRQNDLGFIQYDQFIERLCQLTGADKMVADDMIRRHHTRNAPLLKIITELKKSYKIGMLSNIGGNYLNEFLDEVDLKLFDALSLSGETGHLKPQSEAYADICQKLIVNPEETVFVDDREGFVSAANSFGMKGVQYTTIAALKNLFVEIGIQVS